MSEEYPRLRACFIASLGADAVSRFVKSLSQQEVQFLLHHWPFWARDNQRAPKGKWQTWLLLGGRGCGKTRVGAEWIRAQIEGPSPLAAGLARRVALVAPTLLDAREVMIDGESGLRACSSKAYRPIFSASRRRLKWPNGALAYIFSAEDPDSLRGPQFDRAWCD